MGLLDACTEAVPFDVLFLATRGLPSGKELFLAESMQRDYRYWYSALYDITLIVS